MSNNFHQSSNNLFPSNHNSKQHQPAHATTATLHKQKTSPQISTKQSKKLPLSPPNTKPSEAINLQTNQLNHLQPLNNIDKSKAFSPIFMN
jgi:hypothetical protein